MTPLRNFLEDSFYHVFNRGNRKDNIFLLESDYRRFLQRSKEYSQEFSIKVITYCLMPNHFHFLVKTSTVDSLSNFMHRLSTSYSKYFNIRHHQVGRLFQERFKAVLVDNDDYLLHLSRYIHINPILSSKTKISYIAQYPWSSYRIYLNQSQNEFCNPTEILEYFSKANSGKEYQQFVEERIDEAKELARTKLEITS